MNGKCYRMRKLFSLMTVLIFMVACKEKVSDKMKIKIEDEILYTESELTIPSEAFNPEAKTRLEQSSALYLNKEQKMEMLYSIIESSGDVLGFTNFFTATYHQDNKEGEEWVTRKCNWSDQLDFDKAAGVGLYNICLDTATNTMYAMMYEYIGNYGERNPEEYQYQLLKIDLTLKEVDYVAFDDFNSYNYVSDSASVIPSYQFCPTDGTAVFLLSNGGMGVFNVEKGTKICELPCSSAYYAMDENFVYIYVNNKIVRYDKNSGEVEGEQNVPEIFEGECKLSFGLEGQLYMANHKGVYVQYGPDEEFAKLLDGTRYKELNKKDNYIQDFLTIHDSEFIISFWNENDSEGSEILCKYTSKPS